MTIADRLTATFDVEHNFRKRLVMMLRAQALSDPIAQIRYRIAEMAGFGLRLGDKRVRVRFLPGVSFLSDDKEVIDGGFHVHYGLYEDITATITPAWTFAHYLSVSRNVSDPARYGSWPSTRSSPGPSPGAWRSSCPTSTTMRRGCRPGWNPSTRRRWPACRSASSPPRITA